MSSNGIAAAVPRAEYLAEEAAPYPVFRLSWTAYVREVFSFVIRVLVCCVPTSLLALGLDRFQHMHTQSWLPVVGLVGAVVWTVYSVLMTRSVRLFTDARGVWVESGVFAWEKGISGIQWRDVGQAVYTRGLWSWMLWSYTVHVSHLYTEGSGLNLRNLHRGNVAVMHINAILAELQGRGWTGR